jgi:3-hydroxy-3-methylglutaryl CoA synthase
MKSEPAIIIGTITALVSALLTFAQAFGLDITDAQQDAIRGLVAVLAPIVAGLVIRSFVVAPDTAETKVEEAHASGVAGGPVPSVQV